MSATSLLFRAARLAATGRAVARGPGAICRRVVRIAFGRRVVAPLWHALERIIR